MVNFVCSPALTATAACPGCSSMRLVKYQDRNDNTGRPVVMLICRDCTVIVNATDLIQQLNSTSVIDKQREGSEAYYKVDEKMIAEAPQRIQWGRQMLQFAFDHLPKDFAKKTYADFGAGSGIMAAAAALEFDQAYAVEINTTSIEQLMSIFPRTDNLHICKDWLEIDDNLDFISLWHVVEHLPDARSTMNMIVNKLNFGGAVYIQAPMFKGDHVFDTHYSFFGEPSIRILCENAGLADIQVWYDKTNEFMTCLARKTMA